MIQYSLIAFVLLFIPFIYSLNNGNPKSTTMKSSFILCMLLLFVISAFRGKTVGNDTHEYIRIFEEINSSYTWESRYEKGYLLLNLLLRKISTDFQIVPIVTSAFILYTIGKFIWKHSKYPWLSLFILFANFFSFITSGIRQSIAIAVLLWATEFLIKKRYMYFVISVIIAYSFHNSALLFLASLLLVKLQATWKLVFIYAIIGIMGSVLFSELLNIMFSFFSSYGNYVDGMYFEGDVRLASILYCVVSSLVLISALKVKNRLVLKSQNVNEININNLMIIFSMTATVIYFLSLKVNLLDRFALYFNIFMVVLVPNILAAVQKRFRSVMIMLTVIFYYSYNASILILRPNWSSLYPYEFFWNDNNVLFKSSSLV